MKKFYKFAFFGLSGSGKTCFLTSMAMPRRAAVDESVVGMLQADASDSDEVKEGFKKLREYLETAADGNVPEPTPQGMIKFPVYRYHSNCPQIGQFQFEIADYAGGRLDPKALLNGDKMTEELLNAMQESDGIILLAPIKQKGEDREDLNVHLQNLAVSFTDIAAKLAEKNSIRQCPLALVLSKWDFVSDIPVNSPEAEQENLERFIAGEPLYQELCRKFQGGSFRIFPVSALGKCKNGKPQIISGILQSYGVPFPFIWLAEQANKITMQRLEELEKDLPYRWLPLVRRKWNTVDRLRSDSAKLIDRLPEAAAEQRQRVQAVRRNTMLNIACRSLSAFFLLFLLCYSGWLWLAHTLNGRMLREAELALNIAAATPQDCEKHLAKLKNYTAGSYFPFTPPHFEIDRAKNLIARGAEKKEQIAFNMWSTATGNTKKDAADDYLKTYPQGKYADEIKNWFSANYAAEMREKNQEPLDRLGNLWEMNKNSSSIAEIRKVIETGNAENFFGESLHAADEQKTKRQEILGEANAKMAELKWQQYEQSVQAALADGNLTTCFTEMAKGNEYGEKWQRFAESLLPQAEIKVDEKIKELGSNYSGAVSEVSNIIGLLQALSNAGLSSADSLAQTLNGKIETINRKWDKELYEKVRSNRTETACKNYLHEAPLKTMQGEVDQYKEYLLQMQGEFTVETDYGTYKGKRNDPILVTVSKKNVNSDNYWFWPGNVKSSSGTQRANLKDLISGVYVESTGETRGYTGIYKTKRKILVKAINNPFPDEPVLPVWRR